MATAPSYQRSAEFIPILGCYRAEDGFRWAPVPGENPLAGGKVRVRLDADQGSQLMGTFLNGTITVDPVESDPRSGSYWW